MHDMHSTVWQYEPRSCDEIDMTKWFSDFTSAHSFKLDHSSSSIKSEKIDKNEKVCT
jgi:hypothetical protein